jgi:excinuclease ABC subunit C
VTEANDYAMLHEVLSRRFKRMTADKSEQDTKETWGLLPDLVLIDGGKGQLHAAHTAMKEAGAGALSIASLAKENEEIFIPGRSSPIVLPRNSPALQLIQRVRDESHRFAVAYFTKVHKKKTFTSLLDNIPGIGPKRKRTLLKQFGTVKGIKEASTEAFLTVKGMTPELVERLKDNLG